MEVQSYKVLQLIEAATLAGAYSAAIREDPRLAEGFGRMREKHSRRVAVLAGEICARAAGKPTRALP
jgi:HD superfamily phosphodiesterase